MGFRVDNRGDIYLTGKGRLHVHVHIIALCDSTKYQYCTTEGVGNFAWVDGQFGMQVSFDLIWIQVPVYMYL